MSAWGSYQSKTAVSGPAGQWKVVSIWIGGNDICSRATPTEEYARSIANALEYLQVGL